MHVNMKFAKCDIRVDRNTGWGNPYSHKPELLGTGRVVKVHTITATAAEAVALYRRDLWTRIRSYAEGPNLVERLAEIHGATLGCWCAPGPCHAEVLVKAAAWAYTMLDYQGDDGWNKYAYAYDHPDAAYDPLNPEH